MAHSGAVASDEGYDLGEGVVWDDRAGRVRWVDIRKGRVLSGRLDAGRIVDVVEFVIGQTAGAVALAEDGGLLIAGARGLVAASSDGVLSFGPDLLGDRDDVRLNDGSIDPYGRFVVGSLSLVEETGTEVLLRLSADGAVETLRTEVRLSNGVAFSPDGSTIYHVDTLAGTVDQHSYGPAGFDHNEPWATVIDGFPHYPDGLTVSSDGDLWVAQFGGGCVRRHSPSGEFRGEVAVDARQATCPAFVGPDLDILAITTAQEGLDTWSDHSGAMFLADVGATGQPVPRWPGSTSAPSWNAA